jgi:hypothetical protein
MVYTKAGNAVMAWPRGRLHDAVHRAASSQYQLPLRHHQEQSAAQPPTLHKEHAQLPPVVGVVLYMHNLLRGHNIPPITIISHSISLLLLFLCKLLSIPPDGDVVKNCTGENDVL